MHAVFDLICIQRKKENETNKNDKTREQRKTHEENNVNSMEIFLFTNSNSKERVIAENAQIVIRK